VRALSEQEFSRSAMGFGDKEISRQYSHSICTCLDDNVDRTNEKFSRTFWISQVPGETGVPVITRLATSPLPLR